MFSIDYDKTYTADPPLFDRIIALLKTAGHEVCCVTMRRPDEPIEGMDCAVHYTSRQAKAFWCDQRGLRIDIWIDDSPHWLFQNG